MQNDMTDRKEVSVEELEKVMQDWDDKQIGTKYWHYIKTEIANAILDKYEVRSKP